MAVNTTRLGLLKKDPVVDGNDTFNIKTMLNDNWDAIDTKVETITGAESKIATAKSEAFTDATNKANTAETNAKNASIPLIQKGTANGVAILDASTKVPLAQIPVTSMMAIHDGYMNKVLTTYGAAASMTTYAYTTYYTYNHTRTKGYEKLLIDPNGWAYSSPGGTARAATIRIFFNGVQKYEGRSVTLFDLSSYTIGSNIAIRFDVYQEDWTLATCPISIKTHDVFTIL